MDNSNKFRKINEIESKIISKSLSIISPKIVQDLMNEGFGFYISFNGTKSRSMFPTIYLCSDNLQKVLNSIIEKNEIYTAGLYFGFLKKGSLYISLEATEFLYKKSNLSDFNSIYVNKKGEQAILYGNPILENMILKIPDNLHSDDFLLVFNESKEMLAIAKSKIEKINFQNLKPDDIVAVILSDKGIYLREKQ